MRVLFFGDDGIPDAGAVKVKFKAVLVANLTDFAELLQIVTRPTAFVRRIFDTNQTGKRAVVKIRRVDGFLYLTRGDHPAIACNQPAGNPAVKRNSPALVQVNVRVMIGNEFVAGIGQYLDGGLIGHRTRRKKKRGFHPEKISKPAL